MIIIDLSEFKDVPRYKGRLMINKMGDLYSLYTNKILKPHLMPNGYVAHSIILKNPRRTRTEYVHRLVAETFIPNPDNKATVNHINGNKQDNRIENLEWATQSENNIHALQNSLRIPNTIGFTQYNQKHRVLSDKEIKFIKNNTDKTVKQLSIILNNPHIYAIADCKKGRNWKN